MHKILIVDDEPDIRFLFSAAFKRYYAIFEASNGREALDIFHQQTPALIITDMTMPEMSGMELICEIRKLDRKVKIIASSALFQDPIESYRVMEAGADLCLAKPVTIVALAQAIENLFNNSPK